MIHQKNMNDSIKALQDAIKFVDELKDENGKLMLPISIILFQYYFQFHSFLLLLYHDTHFQIHFP